VLFGPLRLWLAMQTNHCIKVGTVDKFQGQEAAVCFFSMATPSVEEIPRNLEFLFSRNRLNVAISRARCRASLRDDHAGCLEVTVSMLIEPVREQASLTPILDLALAHPRQAAELAGAELVALAQLSIRVGDERLLYLVKTVP